MTFDRDYITGLLRELVGISSANPPGNERAAAEFAAEAMKKIGIDSRVDPVTETRANAVGFFKGKRERPVFVLNGHLDTVPVEESWSYPPFSGIIEKGRMYGLGTTDMKGGISSMIGAVKALIDSGEKINGSVMLSFAADEERKNAGTLNFLDAYRGLDYAVIGEPTNLKIVTSHRGVMRFKIVVFGRAAHASNPSGGVNAIYKMSSVIRRLVELAETLSRKDEQNGAKPGLAVTLIQGGTAENVIPDRCEITIDRRTVHGEEISGVEGEITSLLKEIGSGDGELAWSCEIITAVDAWRVTESSRLLMHAEQAYRRCFGRVPELADLGATCEAVLFSAQGIDTLVFGPGDIANAHTRDEYIEIDQLLLAAQYYCALIQETIGQ